MIIFIAIAIYLACSTTGLLLLKSSLAHQSVKSLSDFLQMWLNVKFVAGFFLYAASFLTWLFLLNKKDLSVIFPIVIGLSYITVFAAALVVLHEEASTAKIIGAVLIGVGILFITIQK
ncbi:MAG: hypothetical protein Q8L09_00805 [Candidatus Moranbacteria bacterium]|nr:hypothetical protein [Candidatus Moranbacteria bacterium]